MSRGGMLRIIIYSFSHRLMLSFPCSSINSLISLYSFSTIISPPVFYFDLVWLTPFLQQQKTTPLHWLRRAISPPVKSRLAPYADAIPKVPMLLDLQLGSDF